jgi:hypothetical protein
MDSRAVLLQRKRDANNGKNRALRHTYKKNRKGRAPSGKMSYRCIGAVVVCSVEYLRWTYNLLFNPTYAILFAAPPAERQSEQHEFSVEYAVLMLCYDLLCPRHIFLSA